MSDEIRYRSGDADKNAILKLALLEAWGRRCYWCTEPKDFADVQIDHIIPRTIKPDKLEELLLEHLPSAPRQAFDLNTTHNLAPICGPCNLKKRDTNLRSAGILSTHLIKAGKLHSKVNGYVRSFQVSNTVTKALLAVSTADLTDPGSKRALDDLGSIMMQRFSTLAPDVLTRYSTSHKIDDPKEDDTLRALVTLDDAGRRTKVILEDYYDMDAADVFLEVIAAIKSEISDRLELDISSELQRYGHLHPEVGPPVGRRVIEIDTFTFSRTDAVFTAEGTFDVDMSAEVIVLSENDSGSESFQSDAAAHGRFSASFWPDDADPPRMEVDTPTMTEWKKGPAPW